MTYIWASTSYVTSVRTSSWRRSSSSFICFWWVWRSCNCTLISSSLLFKSCNCCGTHNGGFTFLLPYWPNTLNASTSCCSCWFSDSLSSFTFIQYCYYAFRMTYLCEFTILEPQACPHYNTGVRCHLRLSTRSQVWHGPLNSYFHLLAFLPLAFLTSEFSSQPRIFRGLEFCTHFLVSATGNTRKVITFPGGKAP